MEVSIWVVFALMVISVVRISIIYFRNFVGTLRIDRTNPNAEIYKIEIDDLDKLSKRKFIILKIDNEADFSQK